MWKIKIKFYAFKINLIVNFVNSLVILCYSLVSLMNPQIFFLYTLKNECSLSALVQRRTFDVHGTFLKIKIPKGEFYNNVIEEPFWVRQRTFL